MDNITNIKELKDELNEFTRLRDWDQFHTPKDLSLALSIEVAEILEHFRWKNHNEISDDLKNPNKKLELSHEIADSFFFILRLASVCDIDLSSALRTKMKLNNEKYPVNRVKGKHKKYNEYEEYNNSQNKSTAKSQNKPADNSQNKSDAKSQNKPADNSQNNSTDK